MYNVFPEAASENAFYMESSRGVDEHLFSSMGNCADIYNLPCSYGGLEGFNFGEWPERPHEYSGPVYSTPDSKRPSPYLTWNPTEQEMVDLPRTSHIKDSCTEPLLRGPSPELPFMGVPFPREDGAHLYEQPWKTQSTATSSSRSISRSISSRSSSSSNSSGSGVNRRSQKRFACKSCNKKFTRQADQQRHEKHVHATGYQKREKYLCDYPDCGRHMAPFFRKDHYRDHLREAHDEDLPKRRSASGFKISASSAAFEDKQQQQQQQYASHGEPERTGDDEGDGDSPDSQNGREKFSCCEIKVEPLPPRSPFEMAEALCEMRIVNLSFWRCTKCLKRMDVKTSDWTCINCSASIEERRKVVRLQKIQASGRMLD